MNKACHVWRSGCTRGDVWSLNWGMRYERRELGIMEGKSLVSMCGGNTRDRLRGRKIRTGLVSDESWMVRWIRMFRSGLNTWIVVTTRIYSYPLTIVLVLHFYSILYYRTVFPGSHILSFGDSNSKRKNSYFLFLRFRLWIFYLYLDQTHSISQNAIPTSFAL